MRLELDGVTAAYGSVVALRDVSLTVPSGAVVALLGPNGAGKTTLLRVASNVLQPRSGRILLDGEDVTRRPAHKLVQQGVCHITEGRSIFRGLTVRENLQLFSRSGDEAEAAARAIDAFPKLGQRLNQVAGTMSGGEQQMLAVARAYTRDASLVLVDELSMGLAPIIVDEILDFLKVLTSQGKSLLLVEQYVAKALEVADLVYLLARGEIVYAAEPAEVAGTDLFAQYLGAEVMQA